MKILSNFESGNIVVEGVKDHDAILSIRPDTNAQYYQWFYFRAEGSPNTAHTYKITNASGASYPFAWAGYQVLASYDEQNWFRVNTQYDENSLNFEHHPTESVTSYAFFVPYVSAQRNALLQACDETAIATTSVLSHSPEGRPIHLITIGDPETASIRIWIVSRQHAGEPMAEWATDGLVRRLLDTNDALSGNLLDKAVFYIVPNMNPDGSAAGNLRANSAGVDLNRVWHDPGQNAPEVRIVRDTIESTGVDYFLDMHGDEARPFIWIAHPGIEISQSLRSVQDQFEREIARLNPETAPAPESIVSGEIKAPGMSINYIAGKYNCPAWIIELPFKEPGDLGEIPDSLLAAGCMRFGRTCLDALASIIL